VTAAARILQFPIASQLSAQRAFLPNSMPDYDTNPAEVPEDLLALLDEARSLVKQRRNAGKKTKPKRSKSAPVSLSENEVGRLLALAEAKCFRNFVLFLLTYRHGFRRAEAVNIRRRDIEGGFLSVRRGKDSEKTEQKLQTHDNPLLDEVRAVTTWLAAMGSRGKKGAAKAGGRHSLYKTSQSTQKGKFCTELRTSAPQPRTSMPPKGDIYDDDRGAERLFPISPRRCHQIFREYATLLGLPPTKRHPHVLKHSIVIHLLKRGVPINEVMAWVGWKSIKTADHYTRVPAAEVAQAVDRAVRGAYLEPQQGSLFL
jgi:integrase